MKTVGNLTLTTPSDREIVMTREFNAPKTLVFRALTEPELVRRWLLGPDGWSMPVCDIDLQVGGKYRYVWRNDENGYEFGMGGEYKEIARPDRIVHTESFDGAGPDPAFVTVRFNEAGGRTTLTMGMLFPSKEIRDATLESGMETGVERSYERLESILPEISAEAN